MGKICIICQQRAIIGGKTSFHVFPKVEILKQQWFLKFGLQPFNTRYKYVCSKHFTADSFYITPSGIKYLKKTAIPTLNLPRSGTGEESDALLSVPSTSAASVPQFTSEDVQQNVSQAAATETVPLECLSRSTITDTRSSKDAEPAPTEATVRRTLFKSIGSDNEENSSGSEQIVDTTASTVRSSSSTLTATEKGSEVGEGRKRKRSSSSTITATSLLSSSSRGQESVFREPVAKKKVLKKRFVQARYFGDCPTELTPKSAKRNWRLVCENVKTLRKKVVKLQQQNRRLKSRVMSLKSLLSYLKENNMITENAETTINASIPSASHEIIKRFLKGPSKQRYTPALRTFALTLHFYSSKAYSYVRQKFNKSLPHPKTLSKWYTSIDGSPGFLNAAKIILSNKVTEKAAKGEQVLCTLLMDEMAVRRRVEWTGSKFTRFVDLGTGLNSDEAPEAKEALVFMLVSLTDRWKLTVAYFLIDELCGSEKANVVQKLLAFLHETGVKITALTFDGAASNMSMATHLGADFSQFDELKTWFNHPITNEKIYLFLDVCHMLKLIRNCLASQGQILTWTNEIIAWKFLEKLVELQEREGLHSATRLRRRHIMWENEKMRVSLAAQTFSKSVADALLFLENDMQLSDFKDAQATANFISTVNNVFDIFNSHTLFAKYSYKRAISADNCEQIFSYLDACKTYLSKLSLDGTIARKCFEPWPRALPSLWTKYIAWG